jgi:8-oxo-dGTP pyrophosphatase MutT (NUDIX family)
MAEPSSPADRALRALGDAVGESRARLAHDGTDPDVPVAATVVLVRDAAEGPEVLLIERPDRGSFAGAWVFPGGKLDDADRHAGDEEDASALRAAVRETFEEIGLTVDPARLAPLSVWDPPPGLPLRIRTWFFVGLAPEGELVLSADEAIGAVWLRPRDALEQHAHGALTLYPPTWVTLHSLAGQGSADALLGAVRLGAVERFETVARRSDRGPVLLWQGDAQYDGAEAGASARHRLELGALPWIYTRTRGE